MGETPCWEGAPPDQQPCLDWGSVCFDVQEQSSFTARELWGWEGDPPDQQAASGARLL
jgi:hypothetical protein